MKRLIILAIGCIALFPTIVNAKNSNGFTIRGEIEGMSNGTIIYLTVGIKGKGLDTLGVCKTQSGKFQFSGIVQEGVNWYFLWVGNEKKEGVLLLDNSPITVTGKLNEWPKITVHGSPSHTDWVNFSESLRPFSQSIDSCRKLKQAVSTLVAARDSLWVAFIMSHSGSLYSPFLALQPNLSLLQKEAAYNKMSTEVQNSRFGKQLRENIDVLRVREVIKVGNTAPDFVSNTATGEKLSLLQAVKNSKYTLVDFWASWCGPCRKQTPNIRKVYAAFHDKGFNVLGVSLDFGAKEWQAAITKDSMPWPQVSELKGREEDAGQIFGLNGIPAYVLVDQQGKIMALDLPGAKVPSEPGSLRDDKLYQKIEALLGNKN